MKGGAIEFLIKSFRDQDLLDAIQLGLSRDRGRRENDKDLANAPELYALPTHDSRGRISGQAPLSLYPPSTAR